MKLVKRLKNLAKTAKITSSSKVDTPVPSKMALTPKNHLPKPPKSPRGPKNAPLEKKLTPEEEEKHRSQLAGTFPAYVYTEERAKEVLEWARQVPEVALDIETHGRLKRDGLLYTRCQVRLIQLHHDGTSFFIDCNHVPDELAVEILSTLKDKPKYLHNALFDIP